MKINSAILFAAFVSLTTSHAEPVFRVLRDQPTRALLANGGFESEQDGTAQGWRPAPAGFRLVRSEGRNGSVGLVCENASDHGWFGASQTLVLNHTNAVSLTIGGWSKALNVSGSADNDYSLYVDMVYADGTPLWGQTAHFRTGTHDWQEQQLVIVPEKPVKSLTIHCLFRGHAGKAWFDDIHVSEAVVGADQASFQGTTVTAVGGTRAEASGQKNKLASGDGLRLSLYEQSVSDLYIRTQNLSQGRAGGFLARDVAANSDFFTFESGSCPELGLQMRGEALARTNHLVFEGRLSDVTGKDRAITFLFTVPLPARGWNWGDDIRRSRTIRVNGEYLNQVSIRAGATGAQSLYPLTAVWNGQTGLALALDMSQPAVFRVGYHAGLERLFIAYDFGLVPETERFPSSADFRFVLFQFDPVEGFRSAWQKYLEIFPNAFLVRSKEQGLWMPFTDVSRVSGWQDFGFRYHEGNSNVGWDDAQGVLSFRYTEPMTWWMPMAKEVPRTLPEALRVRDQIAQSGNASRRRMAETTRLAAMHDETGQPAMLFRDTPWANGAVWSLNPNPWLGLSNSSTGWLNAATVHWNETIKEQLYGPAAHGHLDGEYLDSLEGYVTAELNFRREHFHPSTVPLTFSTDTKQPALFKGLAVYEFTRWISEDVHRMEKLLFANGVPYRFAYLCPWLDILGTETDWLNGGQYRPASLATMDVWRSLSGAKPYLLLMNTDYDLFTPELVEKYFQRALFYGMWPGFFSHNASENPYWQNSRWYERDRPLFKKYLPLIRRVAEAGWQPATGVVSANRNILVERFGPASDETWYLTLYNDTLEEQSGTITSVALPAPLSIGVPANLLGSSPQPDGPGWRVQLHPQSAAVWLVHSPKER